MCVYTTELFLQIDFKLFLSKSYRHKFDHMKTSSDMFDVPNQYCKGVGQVPILSGVRGNRSFVLCVYFVDRCSSF